MKLKLLRWTALMLLMAGVVQANLREVPLPEAVRIGTQGLLRMQYPDGSWGDKTTPGAVPLYRDTSVVVEMLHRLNIREGNAAGRGLDFLIALPNTDNDLLARKLLALTGSGQGLAGLQIQLQNARVSTTARLGSQLYSAAGFPFESGGHPNILDTALAYRALLISLAELSTNDHLLIQTFIRGNQFSDGGWSFSPNTTGDEYITALVLLALGEAPNLNPDLHTAAITAGRAFLVSRQNVNGSWGGDNGWVGETALAALAIQRVSQRLGDDTARTALVRAADWLRANQLIDGTWMRAPQDPPDLLEEGDAFDTAVAVRFLQSQVDLSPTPTATPDTGVTLTPTATQEVLTPTPTATGPTRTPTPTFTGPPVSTFTPTSSPSATPTPSATGTVTSTATITATVTPSSTPEETQTPTATVTGTPPTPTLTPTLTAIPTLPPALTDINGDGFVDYLDLLQFSIEWGKTQDNLDFDGSGMIDHNDLYKILNDWQTPGSTF